jgi:hypothetical protein
MDIIEQSIVALLSSGAATGLSVFVLKKWLETKFDLESKRQLESLKSTLALQSKISEDVLKRYMEGTVSLAEAVYRCRSHARSIAMQLKESGELNADDVGGLMEQTYKVTDYLFRYGMLLRDDQFARIHVFKNTLQRLVVALDDYKDDTWRASFLHHYAGLEAQFQEVKYWMRSDTRLATILDD